MTCPEMWILAATGVWLASEASCANRCSPLASTSSVSRRHVMLPLQTAPLFFHPWTNVNTTAGDVTLNYESNFTKRQFEGAVDKCVEYIRAGDIFQVVISQRLAVQLTVDPFEVYRTLRIVNPSPFMFFLRTPKCTLVANGTVLPPPRSWCARSRPGAWSNRSPTSR